MLGKLLFTALKRDRKSTLGKRAQRPPTTLHVRCTGYLDSSAIQLIRNAMFHKMSDVYILHVPPTYSTKGLTNM